MGESYLIGCMNQGILHGRSMSHTSGSRPKTGDHMPPLAVQTEAEKCACDL